MDGNALLFELIQVGLGNRLALSTVPTAEEWTELREQCTWTWTTQNGQSGRRVTSKKNGNSVFLPAAGRVVGTSVTYKNSGGNYWTNTLDNGSCGGFYVHFASNDVGMVSDGRCNGRPVRPVCP